MGKYLEDKLSKLTCKEAEMRDCYLEEKRRTKEE